MTADHPRGPQILGTLHTVDGKGVVHLEHRYDSAIDEVWSAITDPSRLSRWHGQLDGDLRQGGSFHLYLASDDWEGTGRVEVCEPPSHLLVTSRETDESWRKGQGAEPFDETLDLTLAPDSGQTVLVLEVRGLPREPLYAYGAGWQIHAENLASYLAGRELGDAEARWSELAPAYQELAEGLE
ncbi:MAG: SRPBCC domain-containing protein [Candidatus Dormibacteria bacterium]